MRNRDLRAAGWHALRFWETDTLRDPAAVADQVAAAKRRRTRGHRIASKEGDLPFLSRNYEKYYELTRDAARSLRLGSSI